MATARERHPYAYLAGEEDPRTRRRTVPFEVISAGYSRTGTMTMKAALEILGYPTWHNVTMLANPPDLDMWDDAIIAHFDPLLAAEKNIRPFTRDDFDHLLGYWGASTDQPACLLVEELIKVYPEAKVILVERDEDRWFQSFSATVIDGTYSAFIPLARWLDSVLMMRICRQVDLIMKYQFNVTEPRQHLVTNNLNAKRQYQDNARDAYRKHNAMVKRVVPKDRLLLFQLGEGWEPLCKFLGKDIPKDVPFPRVNETAAAQEMVNVYIVNSYKRALWKFAHRAMPIVAIGAVAAAAIGGRDNGGLGVEAIIVLNLRCRTTASGTKSLIIESKP